MSAINSRSKFEAIVTTAIRDFGYGHGPTPTDAELFERHGVDFTGTIGQVDKWLEDKDREFSGLTYRTVIRRVSTGEFMRRADFRAVAQRLECERTAPR